MPTDPTISLVAAVGSEWSPTAVTALGWTGPPTWIRCSSPISSASSGEASPTLVPEGRLRTSPKAP